MAIREEAFGPDDVSVAATLGSLAGVLMTLRDDAGAKALLERALAIREARYGAGHIETIRTLSKSRSSTRRQPTMSGRDNGMSAHWRWPSRSTAPHVHPMVFDTAAAGVSSAKDWRLRRLRETERTTAGVDRTGVRPDRSAPHVPLHNLALDRRDLGDYAAAKALAERSLAIAERAYGPNHPEVADSLHTLATVLAAQGAYGEALRRSSGRR